MSGLEILVVPALVAAVVCALNDGRDLLAAYKKRRLMKKQSSEVESLDQSLTAISTAIQNSLNSHTNQFGNRFKNDCKSALRPFIESFSLFFSMLDQSFCIRQPKIQERLSIPASCR